MAERPSLDRLCQFSFSAKGKGLSAELHLTSGQAQKKNRFFCFLSKMKRIKKQETSTCNVSLRIRAHLFFLKMQVAAGRLRELQLRLRTWRRCHPGKITVFDLRTNAQLQPLSSQGASSSVLSRFVFARKRRKESAFVCGAGLGAFVLFLLHQASAWATHFPAFALNAGSYVVGFLVKSIHQKCNTAGWGGAAWFCQGVRNAASLLQMALSFFRSVLVPNRFITTALLVVLIGLMLTGKSEKLRDLLNRKKQNGARVLVARILVRLVVVMKLLKNFWVHIGMKHAFIFMLLLAFLSNANSQLEMFM